MPSVAPHLIVIRGNSGSGKTSAAAQLQRRLGRGTANLGQDHLRRIMLREHDVAGGENIAFIDHTARYCLGIGYHVILEGIFYAPHYATMLRRLIADAAPNAHVFYLDVPLAETLRRHELRPMRAEVTPEDLRGWYHERDLLGVPGEVVLAPQPTLEALVERLATEIGELAPARPDAF